MILYSVAKWFGRRFSLSETGNYPLADTYAGKCVNAESALTVSAFWACVTLVSQSIASLPLQVFSKDSMGDRIPQPDLELYSILHDSPNADVTAYDFWVSAIANKLIWGNAYILKHFRAGKKLVGIELLRPDLMAIKENEDGSFTYVYSDRGGRKEYSEDEIMHLKGFTLNGRVGLSVIGNARHSLGNALALQESSGRLYSNGMRPGGALTMPNVLKEDQRTQIRESIKEQVGGVARTGGLIVLEGGMEYKQLGLPPEDAQMLQSMGFGVEDVCRWFGVPPILIGHNEKTTSWGSGIEQIQIAFLTFTLTPHMKGIEAQIKKSLIPAPERKKIFAEFNIEGFLRADSAGRAALYSSATQNGWMTRAEVRRKENLRFKEGSDELTVQSAQINLDDLDKLVAADKPQQKSYIRDMEAKMDSIIAQSKDNKPNITVNIPEIKVPDPIINYSPQVKLNVPQPDVIVHNHLETPIVNVQPAKVNVAAPEVKVENTNNIQDIRVIMPKRVSETTVDYDSNGNIKKTKKVEQDA